MDEVKYNADYDLKRWVGYFDLLGIKSLINVKNAIFDIYRRTIKEVERRNKTLPCIEHAWFSDTFILYTDDESISSFAELDHISRWFLYFLIESDIPARGAIAFGEFYADKKNTLYFGKALIEAYEYGEAQDWIGFILCPTAEAKLNSIGLFANKRLTYAYTNIPLTREKTS